eukprot:SAG31_NODE_10743_length_1103_cov_1.797809_2_plen_197_part_00
MSSLSLFRCSQYRLCPANEALTEDCFQKTPLKFAGSRSWLRWKNGQQVEIDALRVTEGTTPSGSEWSRNPIPTCAGGGNEPCDKGPAFSPPTGCNETCWGYQTNGTYSKGSRTVEMPAIVDKVLIPKNLPSGHYVVGWRWDCEQVSSLQSLPGTQQRGPHATFRQPFAPAEITDLVVITSADAPDMVWLWRCRCER